MFSCHRSKLSIEQHIDARRDHHLTLGREQHSLSQTQMALRRRIATPENRLFNPGQIPRQSLMQHRAAFALTLDVSRENDGNHAEG
jgi:hypothetical protein